MATIDLKEYIISKIRLTSDEDFLIKIKEFIDVKIYSLLDEQIKLVEESNEQYKSGNFIDEEEMKNRVDKWSEEK